MNNFEIGQLVIVKNNLPEPPKRFKNKWRDWNSSNYEGEILEIEADINRVLVKNIDASNAVIIYTFRLYLDNPDVSITSRDVAKMEQSGDSND